MKIKILVFALLFFISLPSTACPIYLIGKIKIVDENGSVIHNARIWKYRSLNDSFVAKKYYDWEGIKDTNSYYIYSPGGWRNFYTDGYKSPDKEYRIQAEGFADVIIRNVDFEYNSLDTLVPTLIITLYGKKYVKHDNSISLLDHYTFKETIKVSDTAEVVLKDYLSFTSAGTTGTGNDFTAKISTYPNPVAKELHIKVNYNITEPVMATLSDAQGREVEAVLVESETAIVNLEGYRPGNYYIVIKDLKGEYLHRQLIIKL